MTEPGKIKVRRFSRRKFITAGLFTAAGLVTVDAAVIEPEWLNVKHVSIPGDKVGCRCVHFTDLHHKGAKAYLKTVVQQINSLKPDYVLFTGDILEDRKYLTEALEILSGVERPMFGVPGNHDYWSKAPFEPIAECFAATGGAWLLNQRREIADGRIVMTGMTFHHEFMPPAPSRDGVKNILLMHYPAWVNRLGGRKFDLILAGHSHGGQVRLPFYGSIFVPFDVDQYDMGLFHTAAGPLYVNPGIGYLDHFAVRFNCRPEITVFDV